LKETIQTHNLYLDQAKIGSSCIQNHLHVCKRQLAADNEQQFRISGS